MEFVCLFVNQNIYMLEHDRIIGRYINKRQRQQVAKKEEFNDKRAK